MLAKICAFDLGYSTSGSLIRRFKNKNPLRQTVIVIGETEASEGTVIPDVGDFVRVTMKKEARTQLGGITIPIFWDDIVGCLGCFVASTVKWRSRDARQCREASLL